ncbi:hypothetical protein BH10BAC5_BH10BAC5_00370 [soil metagenome]
MAKEPRKAVNSIDGRFTLGKNDILRGFNSFQNIFDDHKVLSSGNFVFYYQRKNDLCNSNSPSGLKAGFIVSKKKIRNAVDRIKLKRYLREFYRHNKPKSVQDLQLIISFSDRAIGEFLKSGKINYHQMNYEFNELVNALCNKIEDI